MKNADTTLEAVKAAPSIGVGGLTLFGYPLNEVVLVLTAIYTIFLILDKLPAVGARIGQLWRCLRGKHDRIR